MFQIIQINPNTFNDFKQTLWIDKENVKKYCSIIETNNLQESLNTIFNSDYSKEKLELNTVDVLFTREHTYQIVYSCEKEVIDENYIGSVINYKRKPLKGICVLVKIKIVDVNSKIVYKEAPMSIDDIELVLKDLFFHTGVKISTQLEEIEYDNKYNIINSEFKLSELPFYEINMFGIPFRIWYIEGSVSKNTLSYTKDIGLFLNKKVSEIYITSSIYPQCKCLSLDLILVKQFIDLITNVPDEGELKEITVAYNFALKNQRAENVYIIYDDFYWKVMKDLNNN